MTNSPKTGGGTPAAHAFCAACGTALSAGARFCHRCGTPVGMGIPPAHRPPGSMNQASILPWGIAFVALLALVAMFAGRNFARPGGSAIGGSSNALPTASLDGRAAAAAGAPVDISNMSPSERANRLFVRIMTFAERGQGDSVAFFAPMAMGAHEMLQQPSVDERYHFGLIAEVTGNAAVAKAQADTILAQNSSSLLGLMLAASSARMSGDNAAARSYDQRLVQAAPGELAKGIDEYELHREEIQRAVRAAGGN